MAENKELKEIIAFIVAIAEAGIESSEDGRLSLADARHFFAAARKAGPAFDNMSQALVELQTLGPEGCKALVSEVKEDFDIDDDELERKVENVLDGLCRAYEFYLFIRKFIG